jgi:hypothetical protein
MWRNASYWREVQYVTLKKEVLFFTERNPRGYHLLQMLHLYFFNVFIIAIEMGRDEIREERRRHSNNKKNIRKVQLKLSEPKKIVEIGATGCNPQKYKKKY